MSGGFLTKLTATLEHAVEQLGAADPERKARRIAFTVVHFDDWVGDYQREYFAQMDTHLCNETCTMRSAVVLPE